MSESATRPEVKTVAVIGAGVSGISAAIHLKRAGLNVTVYERNSHVGGIWVYDERISEETSYPSTLPSTGDSPRYEALLNRRSSRQDSPLEDDGEKGQSIKDLSLAFAPPGPCYASLRNNVSTIEMQLSCQEWKPSTEEFVPHFQLAEYLRETAEKNDILESICFNTRVDHVEKSPSPNNDKKWKVSTSKLTPEASAIDSQTTSLFDAIVVSNGNYHAANIPSIPGLASWQKNFPSRIRHSKNYRNPSDFYDQNVLLIGAGVSSMDIARDLGDVARSVVQSSRGGMYDLSSGFLPANAVRVEGVERFEELEGDGLAEDESLPGVIVLSSGRKLCGIHQVILCTGYHVSFPFLRELHADGIQPGDADEKVLVTNGQQTHNLHKDIWYIQDPTLAFIGVPYHVATWSLFEFQAKAAAATFAGKAQLPSMDEMREEYRARLERKGAGRPFHSLRSPGDEIAYVDELVRIVNSGKREGEEVMSGHSKTWLEAYERRGKRLEALFSQAKEAVIDDKGANLFVAGCS